MKKIILCIILICIPSVSFAYLAKVIGISDGDTIKILTQEKEQIKIRLYGVDTPEKDQPYGQKAKKFTSDLVFGKTVNVININKDRFERTVSIIEIGNTTLNEELLKNGFAWFYEQYCKSPECNKWKEIESISRNSKLGLWADKNPTPPWNFRRGEKNSHEDKQPDTDNQVYFRGNTQSLIFHKPGCKFYDCKNCTIQFTSRDEALSANYTPCKGCKP